MVQGKPSAKLGHWRKAKKARKASMISQYHPPPPIKTVGGGGRISREICRFFAFRAIIWRRGSNFPRKMQVLVSSRRHSVVGGPSVGSATRLVAILNHAALSLGPPGLIFARLARILENADISSFLRFSVPLFITEPTTDAVFVGRSAP